SSTPFIPCSWTESSEVRSRSAAWCIWPRRPRHASPGSRTAREASQWGGTPTSCWWTRRGRGPWTQRNVPRVPVGHLSKAVSCVVVSSGSSYAEALRKKGEDVSSPGRWNAARAASEEGDSHEGRCALLVFGPRGRELAEHLRVGDSAGRDCRRMWI